MEQRGLAPCAPHPGGPGFLFPELHPVLVPGAGSSLAAALRQGGIFSSEGNRGWGWGLSVGVTPTPLEQKHLGQEVPPSLAVHRKRPQG